MLAEQSFSRYDCIPHTPSSMFSSTGIWERLSMSGYSPMGMSDKFNNLACAYSPIPFSISLGLGNKRITPKGISNRGLKSTPTSCEVRVREVAILLYIIYHLPLKLSSERDWIIISLANIATFYEIANFFAIYSTPISKYILLRIYTCVWFLTFQ